MAGRVLCIAVLIGQCCVNALAQETSKSKDLQTLHKLIENRMGDADTPAGERELHQLVEKILVLRLYNAVELSDEKLQWLTRHLGSFKGKLTSMKFQCGTGREELRDCLDRGLPEDTIKLQLEALLKQERAIVKIHHEMIHEAGEDLTIAQTAKLYLFVGDFDGFIKKLILRAQYIDRHGSPPGIGDSNDSETDSTEQSLVEELVRLQAAGPTGSDPEVSDLVALFDGLLMAQLSRTFDLGPEETIVLFRCVGTYKDQIKELKTQVNAGRAALRKALKQATADAELKRMLEDLLLQEEALAELISLLVTEAQKDVSLAKSARLYLFVGDFEDYVGRLFERAEKERPTAPARP